MELYKIPKGSTFRIVGDKESVPPGAPSVNESETYTLGNIDGMYSYCTDSKGNVVHVKAWQEVEVI